MAETLATPGRRVKVYVLNAAGKWDDRGTGHVCVENDPDTKTVMIKVTSDETGHISLASTIRPTHEALYQTQEDNIISWNEEIPVGVPTEVALSFQEPEGCRELWDKICQVDAELKRVNALASSAGGNRTTLGTNAQMSNAQTNSNALGGAYPLSTEANASSAAPDNLHNQTAPTAGVSLVDSTAPDGAHSRLFDDNLEGSAWGNADAIDDVVFPDTTNVLFLGNSPASFAPTLGTEVTSPSAFVMPNPDRVGIEKLARVMSDQTMISMRAVREEIIAKVLTSDYITKVCHLFRKAERDCDLDCLSMLYHVIRCLFVIGNNGVLEVLVSEKHLMDVVGCLEYDQEHIPELEKQALELKHTGHLKRPNMETSPVSPTTVAKTDVSSSRPSGDLSQNEQPNEKSNESSRETQNSDAFSPSKQPSFMDIEHPREAQQSEDKQNVLEAEKISKLEGAKEGTLPAGEKPLPSTATDSTPTACNLNDRHSERNNSEETSSSGNMPDGDAPRFSLRAHRDYLERKVSYRSVVPINDRNVVAKIHQNYRVAYIRDVILSRVFDEGMSNMLSGVILCNNVDIIMYFISGSNALQDLFTRLQATVQSRRQMRDATVTSGDGVLRQEKIQSARNPNTLATPGCPAIVSTLGVESMTDIPSDELGTSSAKSDQQKETSSSSGQGTNPTSNPISQTTADSCPTTDPNALTSADQSSGGAVDSGKKPVDTTSKDPKSSEQSEELNEDLRNMLGLLRELCQVVKGQQPPVQVRFHQMLLEFGALEISVGLLLDEDRVLRSLCCDILSSAIFHDQGEVRAHIMKNATQQHSSVPKEQIGSRSVAHGSRAIEGSAIVTEAKTTGVTAEVAVDERHIATTAQRDTSSVEVIQQELCKVDETRRPQEMDRRLASGPKDVCKPTCLSPHKDLTTVTSETSKGSDSNKSEARATSVNNAVATGPKSPNANQSNEKGGNDPSTLFDADTTGEQKQSRVDTDLPLLSAMIEVICQDKESGVALTVLDLLRTLLDPLTMKPPILVKSMFLKAFYEKFVSRLMVPIEIASHPDRRETENENVSDGNVSHICDLLSFCVKNHSFKSKYFVLGHDVGGKVVELLNHKRAHVRLAGVRFIRTCVDSREGMYDRYILEKNLIDPIMTMYGRNQYKDNLTSSAVLELVSFLTNERRVLLLRYVIKEHGTTLQPDERPCRVLEEAKRMLETIDQEFASAPPDRNQTKDSDQGPDVQVRGAEAEVANEQQRLLDKSDAHNSSKARDGALYSHPNEGDLSGQMMIHSAFRESTVPSNARFGDSFTGSEPRSASEADALYSRLTGSATAINNLSSGAHKSNPSGEGGVRVYKSSGAGTPRGNFSKDSPFKMGLRSISQSALPMLGQGFVKPMLPVELRSQAFPQKDVEKQACEGTDDAKKSLSEKGRVTLSKGQSEALEFNENDVIMTDEMPMPNQPDASARDLKYGPTQTRKGEPMKLSMSKSKARDYSINAVSAKDGEVWLSASSEDRHSPRKRERVGSENGIEICSKNVTVHQDTDDDSPSKRRRVENESLEDDSVQKADNSFVRFIESSTLECASKRADGTNMNSDEGKVDRAQLSSRDSQEDRRRHR